MPKYSKHSLRDRLATLIQRLESGKTVQARDVELALTQEQLAAMQAEWLKQQQLRKPTKPQSIADYEKALKSAAMWQGRLQAYKASKPTTYKVFVDREAKQKEMELKVLAELVKDQPHDARPSLQSNLQEIFLGHNRIFSSHIPVIAVIRLNRYDPAVFDTGLDDALMIAAAITPACGVKGAVTLVIKGTFHGHDGRPPKLILGTS